METLQGIVIDKKKLVMQLTGGGAAVPMPPGISSAEVVKRLRDLANMVEQGAAARIANKHVRGLRIVDSGN